MKDTKTNLVVVIFVIITATLYLIAFFNMIGTDIHDVIKAVQKL